MKRKKTRISRIDTNKKIVLVEARRAQRKTESRDWGIEDVKYGLRVAGYE
ncbi:MAG: hypothetical protein GQ468_05240 [Candidatus Scalindua sp.]|jgi:hypothetical protein|nr:hypothetical protein [Candidatus Scalindua sp.]